jgi:hypothetical protein
MVRFNDCTVRDRIFQRVIERRQQNGLTIATCKRLHRSSKRGDVKCVRCAAAAQHVYVEIGTRQMKSVHRYNGTNVSDGDAFRSLLRFAVLPIDRFAHTFCERRFARAGHACEGDDDASLRRVTLCSTVIISE